jgi:hypothetical protein
MQTQQMLRHQQRWTPTATPGTLLLLLLVLLVGLVVVGAQGRALRRGVAWGAQAVYRSQSTTRGTAGPAVKWGCGSSHASLSPHWGR